jgi:hypothetical protein
LHSSSPRLPCYIAIAGVRYISYSTSCYTQKPSSALLMCANWSGEFPMAHSPASHQLTIAINNVVWTGHFNGHMPKSSLASLSITCTGLCLVLDYSPVQTLIPYCCPHRIPSGLLQSLQSHRGMLHSSHAASPAVHSPMQELLSGHKLGFPVDHASSTCPSVPLLHLPMVQ